MKKNTRTPQPPALPFPPAGAPIVPDGMVFEALQLGGVLAKWQECKFFSLEDAKLDSDSDLANTSKEVLK